MATKYMYLSGKTKWFRPQVVNPWGKYTHVLYPDDPSLEIVRDLQSKGAKNLIKKDEDGYYLTISRPSEKDFQGHKRGLVPPMVFMNDGKTPVREINVGNGSDIVTEIEVYEHKTPGGGSATAFRWVSSKIVNLIPFDTAKDFDDREKIAARVADKDLAQHF